MTTTSRSEAASKASLPANRRPGRLAPIAAVPGSPAIGCSPRTYHLITHIAEIKGVTRSAYLDEIVERHFASMK